jgi:hypothetical protein
MPWYSKEQPTPFDAAPPVGLFFLDGDRLAEEFKRDWTKGYKYPMIAFPSGVELALWETSNPESGGIVNIFGELDLPLRDTRDRAYEQASDIAEQCGYLVSKVGDNGLELWGFEPHDHYLITYSDDGVMKNVEWFPRRSVRGTP